MSTINSVSVVLNVMIKAHRIIANFQVLISGNLILSWANRTLKRTDQKYTNESLIYMDPSLEIDSFIKLRLRFELIWPYFTSWTSYVELTTRLIVLHYQFRQLKSNIINHYDWRLQKYAKRKIVLHWNTGVGFIARN